MLADQIFGKKAYAGLKAQCAATGRDPDGLKIGALVHPIVAATKAEAEDKRALTASLPLEVDSLMLLSEALNFDFGAKPIDEPFSDDELKNISGLQTIRDRVVAGSGKKNPSVRDFIKVKLKHQRIRNQEIRAQQHQERLSEIEELKARFGILD